MTLTKRQLTLALDKWRAKQVRAKRGKLRDIVVTVKTRVRYNLVVNRFFDWVDSSGLNLDGSVDCLDAVASSYIEDLWEQGEPKSTASYTLAALQFFKPGVRNYLPSSWQLVKAWQRNELPSRAPPMTALILQTVGLWWLAQGLDGLAISALLGFHCLLRPGEMAMIRRRDLVLDSTSGVVFLRTTKSGARLGTGEAVTITDPLLLRWLKRFCSTLSRDQTLLGMSTAKLRDHFDEAMRTLGFSHLGFKVYSLRRGGATRHFRVGQSLGSTIVRGRWQGAKSARIYIMEGVGAAADLALNTEKHAFCQRCAASLVAYCSSCQSHRNWLTLIEVLKGSLGLFWGCPPAALQCATVISPARPPWQLLSC